MSKYKYNTQDIAKKKVVDPSRKAEAQEWMETVLGKKFDDFFADIRDGVELCEMVNAIKPGTCKKYKHSSITFVARSNIQIFLEGCKKLGLPESDCFETRDLYDGQDLARVVQTFYSFSSLSRKIGYGGPFIGVAYASKNKRNFTQEQLNKSKSAVPKIHQGGISYKNKNQDSYGIVKTTKDMQKPSEVQSVWQKGAIENKSTSQDSYGIVKTSKDMQKPSEVQSVWQKGAKQNESTQMDSYGIVKTSKDMQKPSEVQSVWQQGAKQNESTQMDSYGIIKMNN